MDEMAGAHLDAARVTAGAREASAEVQAAAQKLATWDIVPFTGDLVVVELEAPALPEPQRGGMDEQDCPICAKPDQDYLWSDGRWRVRAADDRSLPVFLLEPRKHCDLGDLDDETAADLGRMTVRIERALSAVQGVGRVHVNRWGDGLFHLHVWFYARPEGMLRLRGMFLPVWTAILPPLPEGVHESISAALAQALASSAPRTAAGR